MKCNQCGKESTTIDRIRHKYSLPYCGNEDIINDIYELGQAIIELDNLRRKKRD